MPLLKLTPHGETHISEEDYARASEYTWYWGLFGQVTYKNPRAYTRIKRGDKWVFVYLHRWLLGEPEGLVVDHINGNTLDNRRENLRACTKQQNMQNVKVRKCATKTSQFKGVYYDKKKKYWIAQIADSYIGSFRTEEEAAVAYNKAALFKFGAYARLNEIQQKEGQLSLTLSINQPPQRTGETGESLGD